MDQPKSEVEQYYVLLSFGNLVTAFGVVTVVLCGTAFLMSIPALLMALGEGNNEAVAQVIPFMGFTIKAVFAGLIGAGLGQSMHVLVSINDYLANLNNKQSV